MNARRSAIAIAVLCVPTFFLGFYFGKNDGAIERLLSVATAQANQTGEPVLAYKTADGTHRYQLPTEAEAQERAKLLRSSIIGPDETSVLDKARDRYVVSIVGTFDKIVIDFQKRYLLDPKIARWAKWIEPTLETIRKKYGRVIERACKRFGVQEKYGYVIVLIESSGDPNCISDAGAAGLTQLMPETAKEVRVRNRFNTWESINGGIEYFSQLVREFGDEEVALLAYFYGPDNVHKMIDRGGFDPGDYRYVKKARLVIASL